MSAAEVIAEIETLPVAELVIIERAVRRLAHPDIPEEVWEGLEDMEDGRGVDMETALYETPPPHILARCRRGT